jgi:hypothetical protein
MRSVVAGQAYYLDDGIYLLPVDNELELREYLSKLSGKVDRVFIARYYFPSDPTLMDRAFLGVGNIGGGYRLHAEKSGDFMNVREFIR